MDRAIDISPSDHVSDGPVIQPPPERESASAPRRDRLLKNAPEFMKDDQAAVEHVLARFRRMQDYKRRYTQRNIVHYEMYRGHVRPRTYPFHQIPRSNIHVPYAFASVEQLTPRYVRAALNTGYDFFDAAPGEKTDRKNAEKHRRLIAWQLGQVDFYLEMTMFIKSGIQYGYTCGKLDWLFVVGPKYGLRMKDEYRKSVIQEEIVKKYGHAMWEEIVEENVIKFDGNRFQCLDWDSGYPDPAARYTLHKGRDFVHETRMTIGEIKNRRRPDGRPLYKNLDMLGSLAKGPTQSESDSDRDQRLATIGASGQASWRDNSDMTGFTDAQELAILEYWTPQYTTTIALGASGAKHGICIHRDVSPFWHESMPFIDWNYTYVPTELIGIGSIESFRDLQAALNTVTNMDLDNWSMMVNQMYAVHTAADVPESQLVSRPWGVIYTRTPPREAIMPIQRQSIAGETAMQKQDLRANIELASGVSDITFRGPAGMVNAGQTATGMVNALEETNQRTQLGVTLLETVSLNRLFRMMATNNQQFLRTGKWIRVTGQKEPEYITPQDIWGEIDFSFRGASRLMRRQTEQHNLSNFLRTLGNSPALLGQLNIRELLRRGLPLFFDESPDELLSPGPDTMMSPQEENYLMSFGQVVEPSVNENLQAHLEQHYYVMNTPEYAMWPLQSRAILEHHIARTLGLLQQLGGGQLGAEQTPMEGPMDEALQEGAVAREAFGMSPNESGGRNEYDSGYV
jgi:hypothetical protein